MANPSRRRPGRHIPGLGSVARFSFLGVAPGKFERSSNSLLALEDFCKSMVDCRQEHRHCSKLLYNYWILLASVFVRGHRSLLSAFQALSDFSSKKKEVLGKMTVLELVSWIITHDRVWRNLPEEFKNQTEEYDELLQEFHRCFEKVFNTDLQDLYGHLDKKEWGEARQKYQDLSAVDDLLDLEMLKSFRFKKLQTKLNSSAGRSRCAAAKEAVRKGEFSDAICVVVTSNGAQEEARSAKLCCSHCVFSELVAAAIS